MPRPPGIGLARKRPIKNDTPRNQQGEPPTTNAGETEDRLAEKEHEDRGQANKDRIEAKISTLKGD